eukprot:9436834-Prorocentrum_lima.AAC.1
MTWINSTAKLPPWGKGSMHAEFNILNVLNSVCARRLKHERFVTSLGATEFFLCSRRTNGIQ